MSRALGTYATSPMRRVTSAYIRISNFTYDDGIAPLDAHMLNVAELMMV